MVLKVRVVVGKRYWSAWRVMTYIAKYSRHELTIGSPKYATDDVDIVYWRWGGKAAIHGDAIKNLHKIDAKLVLGISGYGTLGRVRHRGRWAPWVEKNFCAFTANNLELKRITEATPPHLPVYLCPSGVDLELFNPTPFPEEFSIGWAGNPKNVWKTVKRFRRLPFTRKMVGPRTEAGKRKYEDMPDFYSGISVYVSTSSREGSPLPPKEAAASGRPVVCTAAGDLVEWVPPEYVVKNYRDMIPIIERFRDDRSLLVEEGRRFRELALAHDYKRVVDSFDRMFDEVMKL